MNSTPQNSNTCLKKWIFLNVPINRRVITRNTAPLHFLAITDMFFLNLYKRKHKCFVSTPFAVFIRPWGAKWRGLLKPLMKCVFLQLPSKLPVLRVSKAFGPVGKAGLYIFGGKTDSDHFAIVKVGLIILPETNIAPQNGWLEDDPIFCSSSETSC